MIGFPFKVVGSLCREIAQALNPRADDVSPVVLCSQEKLLSVETYWSVPQTDTGGQVEYTQVFERSQAKELCNLLP